MRSLISLLAIAALGSATARAAEPARPVVVELFTSEGCSSCPPADALLAELAAQRPDVLPLAFHVTYWDYLGWRDPFGLDAATERQRRYARIATAAGPGSIYTPQMVIDGRVDAVGSDRAAVQAAIRAAAARPPAAPILQARRAGGEITAQLGAGTGSATLLLVGYDRSHRTPVGRGENAGRTLAEANIVRGITPLGRWSGTALELRGRAPRGELVALLLQQDDGAILTAARLDEAAAE